MRFVRLRPLLRHRAATVSPNLTATPAQVTPAQDGTTPAMKL